MFYVSYAYTHSHNPGKYFFYYFFILAHFFPVVSYLLSSPGRGAFLRTDDLAVSIHMVAVKSGQLSAP
jgi:hypothetical protein